MKQFSTNSIQGHRLTCWPLIGFWLWASAMLVMIAVLPAMGDYRDRRPDTSAYATQGPVPLPKAEVTIVLKSRQSLTTTEGQRYGVTRETLIVGTDGKEITLNDLPVPSTVTLTYAPGNGVSWARRVDINRIAPNASKHMNSEVPQ